VPFKRHLYVAPFDVVGDAYHITVRGASHLAEALEVNATLTSLSLADQQIEDDGAIALAR